MKQADSKDKSSVLYIGKGVIILAVIITASLSFVLGFFVGKSIRPQPVSRTSALSPQTLEPVVKEEPVRQPGPVRETAQPPVSGQTLKVSETEQVQGTKGPKPAEGIKKQHLPAKSFLPKETRKNILQNGAHSKRYAVQVEAFKHASSAGSLREKLNRKGYKASVTSVKTKKHEKLYKVIVGDFQTRKEAETFSAKLRRSENLKHAFVIPKDDQEVLR